MQRCGTCLSAMVFGLGLSIVAQGGVRDAPDADLEVSLITYGPGAIYWERFGHDAIRLRDRVSGESVDFNYGVFDFEDSHFLSNFARGDMLYLIDVERSDIDQQDYIDTGRSVVEQRLALSASQASGLRSFLIWNLQPENSTYHYDYLTDNCATRVRDALNRVLGDALRKTLVTRPAQMTYRQQIDRLMSAQPWLMLAMDVGLGPFADRPLNGWQESFLPIVLAREIRSVTVPDGKGGVRPLVASERTIAQNRLEPPRTTAPNLDVPLGIAGLLLAGTILASRSRLTALHVSLTTAYLLFAGVVGTLLLALWTLTLHRAAWGNANLLVFNPVAFVILGLVWRNRRAGGQGSRLARTLVSIQLIAALLAVLQHILVDQTQQNLPWLLFGIPPWLAIAVGLFRQPKSRPV